MKFKVGDKVKVIKAIHSEDEEMVGKIFKITKTEGSGYWSYLKGHPRNPMIKGQLELVTPRKSKTVKRKTKFYVGAIVENKETKVLDVVLSLPGMPEYDNHYFVNAERGFHLRDEIWAYKDEYNLVDLNKLRKDIIVKIEFSQK